MALQIDREAFIERRLGDLSDHPVPQGDASANVVVKDVDPTELPGHLECGELSPLWIAMTSDGEIASTPKRRPLAALPSALDFPAGNPQSQDCYG